MDSPRLKRPEYEADPSSPHSTEVKNSGDIPSLSHTSSFTFCLYDYIGLESRDSLVSTATVYELDSRGSITGWGKRFFSTRQSPDHIRGPFSLLSNGYQELFHGVKAAG
jgi:hypothetical protein